MIESSNFVHGLAGKILGEIHFIAFGDMVNKLFGCTDTLMDGYT